MTDVPHNDVNYGNPGPATFDLQSQEWSFVRQYTTKKLKQVQGRIGLPSPTTCTIPPSELFTGFQVAIWRTSVQNVAANLATGYPSLAPAVHDGHEVSELALVSTAVQKTAAAYDPLVGNLVSFGSLNRHDKKTIRRRVVALAHGEARNILQLCILNDETCGWETNKSVWLQGPTLRGGDLGYWNEDAAPIQQVCFAQTDDRSTLLAVRLPTRTVIFRPVYYTHRRTTKPSALYHLPASVVDAHPVLSIGIDQTGGVAHADVTFNPDFQLQFAIVNQDQTWSIWDVEHRKIKDTYEASCLITGDIYLEQDEDEDEDAKGEDGWARILWIGDVNTVLICNRRHLRIVALQQFSYSSLPCPSLISDRSGDWILEVKRHPSLRSYFLVLTSTSLILMKVTTSNEGLAVASDPVGANVVVSWNHFRDKEDFTLRLSVQMLVDDETCCFLHSRFGNLIQVFIFQVDPENPSAPILSCDPGLLNLTLNGSEHIDQLRMEPMEYDELQRDVRGSGSGRLYKEKGVKFYRLFVTRSDSSVYETTIYMTENELHEGIEKHDAIQPFTWNVLRRHARQTRKDLIDEMDDFIEPNEVYGAKNPQLKTGLQAPKWAVSRKHASLPREIDCKFLYDALTETDRAGKGDIRSMDTVMVLNNLEASLLGNSVIQSHQQGTLLEVAGKQLEVSDIDEASNRFQDLRFADEIYKSAAVQRLASPSVLELCTGVQSSMADVYDDILNSWIKPLPSYAPNRVRQRKERLARRIAAEVMLASSCIRHPDLREITTEGRNVLSQDDIKLPILPSEPVKAIKWGTSEPDSSLPLPTPLSPYKRSSSQPVVTQSESSMAPTTQLNPLARLGRYLRIDDSSKTKTTPTIPPSVKQLLAHWQLGSDPSTYDWEAFERTIESENLDEVAQEEKEKDRRRRERRQKRQQREDELMRAKAASQQSSFPRSSPGPMLGGMDSSSQVPSQLSQPSAAAVRAFRGPEVVMSQVEPGKFGGRLDKEKKKKKKNRVSGF